MTAFEELLVVQDLDTRFDQLRHRLAHLPERAVLIAAERALTELRAANADAGSRRDGVRREQRRLEDEVATVEAKVTQVDGQLYGGTVTSPKELEALQHELEGLRERQRGIEDQVIEQMEAAEPIDADLASLSERISAEEQSVTVAGAELDAAVAVVEGELAEVASQREDAAAGLPAELMSTYESIRKGYDGVGAARLDGGRCLGCHLAIPSAQAEELKRAPADEILTCPECGRILVR